MRGKNEPTFLFSYREAREDNLRYRLRTVQRAKLYTNDVQNATKELYRDMFKEGDCVEIGVGQEIEIDDSDNIVFDFGVYIDSRLIDVIKYVDACVVPISYQSK